jgi:ERCC4-type nuclease
MELIIDNRESIKDYFKDKKYVTFKNLELGDYVYKYNGEDVLIIERKTVEDYAASIKDGRYREQKQRLLSNYSKHKLLYLIEGDLTKNNKSFKFNKVDKYTIYSSMINCYLRDTLNIFHSHSISETVDFLENMAKKLDKGIQFLGDKSKTDNNLLGSIKKTKKANLTPELVYKSQLTTIPNVSYKTADIIISYYPKLNDLLTNLGKLEQEERINIIKNLKDKSNKGKKIGIKVGENINKYLFY